MHNANVVDYKAGLIATAGSYIIWGVLPVYWKVLGHRSADEILAHRIIWCFVFSILLVLILHKKDQFLLQAKHMLQHKKAMMLLLSASLLISINWMLYIWMVNNERIVEASLGYYINPLISVLLGMIILHERLHKLQWISFLLAFTGVLYLTISFGSVPWMALTLAISFGLYGLAKKRSRFDAITSLTMETVIVFPFALLYIIYGNANGDFSFLSSSPRDIVLLIGSGIATATPLILFAYGAQRIPLFMLGFLQYIAPTISLLIGTVFYEESFTQDHAVAFTFIWSALLLFSLSNTKWVQQKYKRANGHTT
nr:EamA family transporter RarD [Longirhabdus pacifica]